VRDISHFRKYCRYLKHCKNLFTKDNPFHVTFFVTSRCNFKCGFCFYWKRGKGKELSLSEIEKVSENMNKFTWLLISGGEPFLRKDLAEICEKFYLNNGVDNITIPTNGYFTKRILNITEKVLKECNESFININLSVHGIGKDHDKVTGVRGSFPRLLKTYKGLSRLKRKYKNMGIGVILTFSFYTQDKIFEVYDFVMENMEIDHFGVNFVRGAARDIKSKKASLEKYKEFIRFLEKEIYNRRLPPYKFPFSEIKTVINDILTPQTIIRILNKKTVGMPCYAGKLTAVIDEIGNVYPCELLNRRMGNLRDENYDFQKIWNSKKSEELRKWIKKNKCVCTHECVIPVNLLFNPKKSLTILHEFLKYKYYQRGC
jgi:MoaA/NifB/PqqE/SkfB family radical SAM enzyme